MKFICAYMMYICFNMLFRVVYMILDDLRLYWNIQIHVYKGAE